MVVRMQTTGGARFLINRQEAFNYFIRKEQMPLFDFDKAALFL